MAWVEVETDTGPWVLIAGGLALVAGATVFLWHGFCAGTFTYLGVGFTVIQARQFWLQAQLPRDARSAARRVLAWFREQFPGERVEGVAVRAVEPERFVIAIRHGFGRPTPRRYFTVPRTGTGGITEVPVADWWPRGLR